MFRQPKEAVMMTRSTLTRTIAAFAASLVLIVATDGAQARRGDGTRVSSVTADHGVKAPGLRFTRGTRTFVNGIEAPMGTNAPARDPIVRDHSGPNGEGGVTVTSHPRQPNPCSGFFHGCLEESRDHRGGWKAPPGRTVHDHRN
jgi:hypothetical protein